MKLAMLSPVAWRKLPRQYGFWGEPHNHFDYLPLTYMNMTSTPVLTTIHGFPSSKVLPVYKKYNSRAYYVAILRALPRRSLISKMKSNPMKWLKPFPE